MNNKVWVKLSCCVEYIDVLIVERNKQWNIQEYFTSSMNKFKVLGTAKYNNTQEYKIYNNTYMS